ncbi:MAG: hypothetical protein K1Y36_15135 [Blastocatellia bacterium]|nr:hypothetical protein [Blastocatellia bacterium]
MWRWGIASGLLAFAIWFGLRSIQAGQVGLVLRYQPRIAPLEKVSGLASPNPLVMGELGHRYLYDLESSNPSQAFTYLTQATQLAPCDFRWWRLRAKAASFDHPDEVEKNLLNAHRLAPSFFQTNWDLAAYYLQQDKVVQATPFLKQSFAQNPSIVPLAFSLLPESFQADPGLIQPLVPQRDDTQWAFVTYLVENGKPQSALAVWHSFFSPYPAKVEIFSGPFIKKLIETHFVSEAWEIWKQSAPQTQASPTNNLLDNGDFAQPLGNNGPNFGWQVTEIKTVTAALDAPPPKCSGKSLVLEFDGESRGSYVWQLLPVKPLGRYRFSFWSRTEQMATGVPVRCVAQTYPLSDQNVMESSPSASGTAPWTRTETVFQVPDRISALTISIGRYGTCPPDQPCSIFGRLWFGGFELQELQ